MSIFGDLLKRVDKMAIAYNGDYDFGNLSWVDDTMSSSGMSFYPIIDRHFFNWGNKILGVGKHKYVKDRYMLYQVVTDNRDDTVRSRAKLLTAVQLQKINNLYKLNKFGYENVYLEEAIETAYDSRGNGYGFLLYLLLLSKYKISILSDNKHYDGARKLWKRLSEYKDTKVDIVDISGNSNTLVQENVIIKSALDNRIWIDEKSYNDILSKRKIELSKEDKKSIQIANNIRLIVTYKGNSDIVRFIDYEKNLILD